MKANLVLKIATTDVGDAGERTSISKLVQRFSKYVWQNRAPFFVALVAIFCLSFFQVLVPQITRYVIDVVIPQQKLNQLPWVAGAILAVSLIIGVLNFLRSHMMSLFGQRTINSIRNDLYQHIQKLSIGFFEKRRTGDLMARLSQDVNALGGLITADVADILADSFTFVVIVVYLLSADWQLTLLLLVVWPIMVFLNQFFGRFLRGAYHNVQQQQAAVNNHIQDTLSNINVIKSFGNESYEIDRFFEHSSSYMEANIRAVQIWSLFFPIIDIMNNVGTLIVLVFGSWEVVNGRLSIGEVAAFLAYITQINQPIRRFSRVMNIIQLAIVSSDRIFEILETEPEVIETEDAVPLTEPKGQLRFEQVQFAYRSDEPVLHDFSLDIQPGTTVALVGASGAGKSTIAKLAARFYDPTAGKVWLDDHDLKDITLDSLRDHIGIVAQETLLLYGTVRDNIAYGKLDATDAEIEAAAKAANAHGFITSFPEGYDTIIGERGVRLSGGQRQRLAIARVLLKNPQFILLDEATSALDTESESLIQSSLENLLTGRTSLVIAHRLSTIQNADLIVVLEAGKIIETGTHTELLAKRGRYAQLHAMQFPTETMDLPKAESYPKKLELVDSKLQPQAKTPA